MKHYKKRFSVVSPAPIVATNDRGEIFENNQKRGKFYQMNLPAGNYSIVGPHEIRRPRAYERLINLPLRDRFKLQKYDLEYDAVPSIGLIDHKKGVIYLDQRLKNEPKHINKFVYLHEIGHTRYKDEHTADLYAAKKLLSQGYDPQEIINAAAYLRTPQHVLTKKLKSKLRKK